MDTETCTCMYVPIHLAGIYTFIILFYIYISNTAQHPISRNPAKSSKSEPVLRKRLKRHCLKLAWQLTFLGWKKYVANRSQKITCTYFFKT